MRLLKSMSLILKIMVVLFITLFMYGCSEYTLYVPVELVIDRGEHKLQKNSNLLTSEHIKAMEIILKKYDEDYKIKDDKLYIKKELMRDLDLLQNYTFKAEVLRKKA